MGPGWIMFAVFYIPDFFLQAALRHQPELAEKPVVLIDESLPKAAIVQLTDSASLYDIKIGMTSTQALARCRDVIILPRSPLQEKAASEILLQCCFLFSPYVEATAPGIYTIDLKGQRQAVHENFGAKVLEVLQPFQLKAQIGIAPTPLVAFYAAHRASSFLKIDHPREFLSDLPIETLKPPASLLNILHRWGIWKIGSFLALGKDALAERLGPEALALFEQASSTEVRPLKLTHPSEVFEESFEFENEIESLEPLLFILRRFIEQIALRLALSSFAAEQLLLRLTLSEGNHYEQLFKIPAPTTTVEVLFRVLYTHLENVRTEHPIKALFLSAKPCRPVTEQFNLFDCVLRDPNGFYETIGRLNALLGLDRVGFPDLVPTHRPDAFQMQPVDFNAVAEIPDSTRCRQAIGLPLRRFRPPLPARVDLRQQRPCALQCTLMHGSIRRADGPWRSSGDWWDKQSWGRDEWDIQTHNGKLYRVYCEGGNWFLEGVYD